ncbi:hypothetical protein COX67_05160, partial [Candidatus Falkowbacteria bacterium CG_4_10_14_0_2_um_filter_36_22]
ACQRHGVREKEFKTKNLKATIGGKAPAPPKKRAGKKGKGSGEGKFLPARFSAPPCFFVPAIRQRATLI